MSFNNSPVTLIVGENGAGKCLHPHTKVSLNINDSSTKEKLEKFINERTQEKSFHRKKECTIEDIYEFYKKYPEEIGNLEVETRHGFKTVEYADITAYDSEVISITLDSGKEIKTSPDHLLFDDDWVKSKNLKIGDRLLTKNGIEKIVKIHTLPERQDLYDLQVAEVKEFYANGFVSHNSTMLDALTFALFSKPFRKIKKGQLINSINQRECLVEVEFSIGKKEYMIRRGIKPLVFEIYCDNKIINQDSTNKDYQKNLEEQILKMNYKTFTQVVILGNSFIPFMQLTAADRRSIIEDLLDIQIFSSMNVLLKQRISESKDSINKVESEISVLEEKIKIQKRYIENIKKDKKHLLETNQNNLKKDEETLEKLSKATESLLSKVKSLQDTIKIKDDIEDKKNEAVALYSKLSSNKERKHKHINFFKENDTCRTCTQPISKDFSNSKIKECEENIEKIEDAISTLDDRLIKYDRKLNKIKDIQDKIFEYQNKIQKYNGQMAATNKHKNSILKNIEQLKTEENKNLENDIEKLKVDEEIFSDRLEEKNDILNNRHSLDIISMLLKDSGIKTKIISQYLPIINKTINKYLNTLGFQVLFELDDNFNETIKSRYRDEFSYNSFSEGEKQRIDLALLFTWRDIAKMRNSANTNLLILDEVFDSSLDESGTEEFMKLLKTMDENINTFIISHHGDALYDRFNSCIEFKKTNNFSEMVFNGG